MWSIRLSAIKIESLSHYATHSAPAKMLVLILKFSEHDFTEIARHGETDAWGLFVQAGAQELKYIPLFEILVLANKS